MIKAVKNYEIIVPRYSANEFTFAVIKFRGEIEINAMDLMRRLIKVLSEWARDTTEGRLAWDNSDFGFNVGDLVHCSKAEMICFATKLGLVYLNVEIYSHDNTHNWEFDTILVDEDIIYNEAGESCAKND